MKLEFKRFWRNACVVILGVVLAACATDPRVPPPELLQRIESARTRADHEGLAAYYDKEAAFARGVAEGHRKMARAYGSAPVGPRGGLSMSQHCNAIIRQYEGIATEFEGLATTHRQMAASAPP